MTIINVLSLVSKIIIVLASAFLFFIHKMGKEIDNFLAIDCIIAIVSGSSFMWISTLDEMLLNLLILICGYTSICFFIKKAVFSINTKIVIFFLVSVVFLWWSTVLFGKLYMDNCLEDSCEYYDIITRIIDDDQFFIVMNLRMSVIYLSVGIERYFIVPNKADINDLQFLQFIFGFIAGGTVITTIFSIITKFIAPSHNKPNTQN